MSLTDTLERRAALFTGTTIADEDVLILKHTAGDDVMWLAALMKAYRIAGSKFTLHEDLDLSGLGVELQWFAVSEVTDAVDHTEPAMSARRFGFLPVGDCLLGTGDPYFVELHTPNSPLYRIPHLAVSANTLDLSQVEKVTQSLEAFFEQAEIR